MSRILETAFVSVAALADGTVSGVGQMHHEYSYALQPVSAGHGGEDPRGSVE